MELSMDNMDIVAGGILAIMIELFMLTVIVTLFALSHRIRLLSNEIYKIEKQVSDYIDELSSNPDWKFTLSDTENEQINPEWQTVSLPHTWNNYDGQDGGANYHTGVGTYAKEVNLGTLKPGSRVFIEVQAAANAGQIFVNGKKAAEHEGGFSIFRADITDDIHDGDNLIELKVDNTPRADIYPQMADFTFYGGLYRDVNILIVPETHFDLSYQGSQGIAVSS